MTRALLLYSVCNNKTIVSTDATSCMFYLDVDNFVLAMYYRPQPTMFPALLSSRQRSECIIAIDLLAMAQALLLRTELASNGSSDVVDLYQ